MKFGIIGLGRMGENLDDVPPPSASAPSAGAKRREHRPPLDLPVKGEGLGWEWSVIAAPHRLGAATRVVRCLFLRGDQLCPSNYSLAKGGAGRTLPRSPGSDTRDGPRRVLSQVVSEPRQRPREDVRFELSLARHRRARPTTLADDPV